jgi:NAD(P)-dependent dehydrogenase (short-subunit alcohol dehydrogenase family)
MTSQDHEGQVALITGGGRGFGLAFGHALAARGATVVLVDVDAAAAEQGAAEVRAAGGRAEGRTCDVADEDGVAALIAELRSAHGGIDLLVNNAGLHSEAYNQPMVAMGVATLRRLVEVNVMGTIICSLAAREAMLGRPGASIINISSSASYSAGTAYGVTKLAVRGLTASFAHEFGPDGIRVNAIAPGLIFTDTIRAELNPDSIAHVMAQQILSREGAESDIVDALLFLCSPAASFITGETLRVSGGFALTV